MSAILRTFVLRNEPNANALWQFLKNNWRALAGAGTLIALALLGMVDDDEDAPEAMTGDDYHHSDAADR